MLKFEFDRKDLGNVKKILGMEITRDHGNRIMSITQHGYIKRVIQRFNV